MNIRTTRKMGLTAFVAALAFAFGTAAEAQSITGEWEVAGGAMYGKLIPSSVVYTMTLTITGDNFTANSGNLTSTGTVTADAQATPSQITFKIEGGDDPGRELKGIFKFEGRNLMITFSESDEFPAAFESTADNGNLALSYQASTGRRSLAKQGDDGGRNVARNRRGPATQGRPPTTLPAAGNGESGATAF